MKKTISLVLLILISFSIQAQNIQSFIKIYAQQHSFNGNILVKQGKKIAYCQSFGIANREFAVPFTNNTEFKICSITKTFTAVLIFQLVENGKIDINQYFGTYLPEYKGEAGNKVTISQLLNHTSGIGNIDTVKSWDNALKYGIGLYQKPYTLKQLVNNFCSGPLKHLPGSTFDYNNADYMILGRILEVAYQSPFDEILNEKLLKPLKMIHSGLLDQEKLIPLLASTYYYRKDINLLTPDLPIYVQDLSAAGAMYSNAGDLVKFWEALFALKLITKSSLNLMLTPGLDDYGYSVWIRDYKGKYTKYKRMERYGTLMGANTVVFRYLNKDITIIILSNTNLTDLGDFALNIGKQIF